MISAGHTYECEGCGIQFLGRPRASRNTRFCSAACRYDVWRRIMPEPNSGCWLWTGHTIGTERWGRYGAWSQHGENMAHRAVYVMLRGAIARGLELDHLCKVKLCVNPDHMEPVTPSVNRGRCGHIIAARASLCCRKGHLWSEQVPLIDRNGYRKCATCNAEWCRAKYLRRKLRKESEHVAN